jgi:ArsR family transcriptional regulator
MEDGGVVIAKEDIEKIDQAADIFKAFGNTMRIRIIDALQDKEMRVKDIAMILGCPQPIVSQQLKILRGAGIVKKIMDGRSFQYALTDQHYSLMIKCMKGCLGL